MGTMDIRKQRLIKQCQVILGEDFDKDFIYEDVDFSNARAVFKAYKLYEAKEEGTDELVSQFKKDTPGELEELKEPFVVFNKKTKEVLATGSNSRSLFARRSGYARDNGLTVKDLEFKKVSKKQTVGTTLKEAENVIAAKNELEEKKIAGLVKKAEKSGISYGILKQVYNRGMAAWKTGHRPGTTPQQWAFARVNSFLTGGKTRTTADADLWAKTRK